MNKLNVEDYEDVLSADVAIKDPMTGAPTAVTITLAGPEHPARRRIMFDRQRKMRAGLQKTGKIQLGDPEEDETEETALLVAATLGWTGLQKGNAELPYSKEAAQALYADPKRRWLREQVKAALDERERFISRSATS